MGNRLKLHIRKKMAFIRRIEVFEKFLQPKIEVADEGGRFLKFALRKSGNKTNFCRPLQKNTLKWGLRIDFEKTFFFFQWQKISEKKILDFYSSNGRVTLPKIENSILGPLSEVSIVKFLSKHAMSIRKLHLYRTRSL